MELKDKFDKIMNYVYSYNGIINDYSETLLVEEEDDLSKFMITSGENAANNLFCKDISLEEIALQNMALKKTDEDNIYEYVANMLSKNKLGYFTKKEFNLISTAYFTIGVDNILKTKVNTRN